MAKNNKVQHTHLGRISRHHLVPRMRLKIYYGNAFKMPRNILRLWRFKHDAWHVLFNRKTINETLKYLKNPVDKIYGYKSVTWKILFGDKNKYQVIRLLTRIRNMVRKQYSFLELDPSLRRKALLIEKQSKNRGIVKIYLDKKFKHVA